MTSEKKPIPVLCSYKEMVATTLVKPNPKNPNKHGEKQIDLLAKIILKGWRHPILVSNLSGYIVAGHGRLIAAKKIGTSEVPVDYQDFSSPEEELAFLLADNRIPELAEWDKELQISLLTELTLKDFDVSDLGFKKIIGSTEEGAENFEDDTEQVVQVFLDVPNNWYQSAIKKVRVSMQKMIKQTGLEPKSEELERLFLLCWLIEKHCETTKKRFSVVVPVTPELWRIYKDNPEQVVIDMQEILYAKYRNEAAEQG